MKKRTLYLTAGILALCLAGAGIPKLMTFLPNTIVSAADKEITEDTTLEADMTVDGDLLLLGGTLNLNGHKLTVNGTLWHKAGILEVSNGSTLKIAKNYEMREGYSTAGSGELRFRGEGKNLMDVDGDVNISTTIERSHWQDSGTLQIGGSLNVWAPKKTEASPMGNGLEMDEGTVVTFKGDEKHSVYFATNNDSYISNIAVTGNGSLYLNGNVPGFKLASDVTFADGSTVTGSTNLVLNGYTLTVDGTFNQDGSLMVDLTNSTMNVSSDYWQRDGILKLDNSTLHIGRNYEMRAGYTTAGSGELQMQGDDETAVNLLDVDGDVNISTTQERSYWQDSGTLQIGGNLNVWAPKKTEASPMGNGLEMDEGTVVTFKGDEKHSVYFATNNDSYISNIAVTGNGSLYLNGNVPGFKLASDVTFADGSTVTGKTNLVLNGYTLTVDGTFNQDGSLMVDLTNSTMNVSSDYWQRDGILRLDNSTLHIGRNYEMRAGYSTAGSGELQMQGDDETAVNLLDVDGDVNISTTQERSYWQTSGTLQIGGNLNVWAPKKTEATPMGNGLEMNEGTVVSFKGTVMHTVYFDTYDDSYISNVAVTDGGSLLLSGQTPGFKLVSDAVFADDSVLKGGRTLKLNGHTVYVDGSFSQDGDCTVDLTNSKMVVLYDYWHKQGILNLDNSTLIIGHNYEMKAGYTTAGSGELRMQGDGTNLMDVHGDANFSSTVERTYWQTNGTFAVGGNLSVWAPKARADSPVGKGFQMETGTITKFYGAAAHNAFFEDTSAYTGAIMMGVGDTVTFTGKLNGLTRGSDSAVSVDPASLVTLGSSYDVTGASKGTGTIVFTDGSANIAKTLYVVDAEEIPEIEKPEILPGTDPPVVDPPEDTRSPFELTLMKDYDDRSSGIAAENEWYLFRNMDFEDGARSFTINCGKNKAPVTVELRLDTTDGTCIGTLEIPQNGEDEMNDYTIPVDVTTGLHDLYIVPISPEKESYDQYFLVLKSFIFYKTDTPDTPPEDDKNTRSAFVMIEAETLDQSEKLRVAKQREDLEVLAFITNGAYALYENVDFGDGARHFYMEANSSANTADGGTVELHLDSADGTLIGSIEVGLTGTTEQDWLDYYVFETNIPLTTGVHDLYLVFKNEESSRYLLNVDKFVFYANERSVTERQIRSAFEPIKGLEYNEIEGTLKEDSYGVLGWTREGDWALYSDLDFGTGAKYFKLSGITTSDLSEVELHLDSADGTLIGTCKMTQTGGYGSYIDYVIEITETVGVHDLYLVFRNSANAAVAQVNEFVFSKENPNASSLQGPRSAFEQIFNSEQDENNYNKSESPQWVVFRNLDFEDGAYSFTLNGGHNKAEIPIELHLDAPDGPCIGTINAPPTAVDELIDNTIPIESTEGIHDFYLVFSNPTEEKYDEYPYIYHVEYFFFSKEETKPNPDDNPPAAMRGDVNGDGSIDLKDVIVLRRCLAGGWDVTIVEGNSDVNNDGSIDLKDVIILRRYLAGGWDITLE